MLLSSMACARHCYILYLQLPFMLTSMSPAGTVTATPLKLASSWMTDTWWAISTLYMHSYNCVLKEGVNFDFDTLGFAPRGGEPPPSSVCIIS